MTISVIGLNHKSANIDIREKFSFTADSASLLLRRIKKVRDILEVIVVSTCNRTEIYCESTNGADDIKNWLLSEKEYKSFAKHLYIHQEEDAIEHLFKVVAGLDSMVIGESEVLGQVKTAYKIALDNKSIDGKLKRLFEYSFSVAKNVRTNTDIGGNAISFMYTSILLIKKIFSTVEEKKCLLIGAGEMTELALKYLKSNNVNDITICNRKEEKGKKLALENSCRYSNLNNLSTIIHDYDVIITSTSSSLPLIGKGNIENALIKRNNDSIVIIDLGVPRDVESQIKNLDNVYLYTIDDLGQIIEKNYKIREKSIKDAEEIIKFKIVEYKNWLSENNSTEIIKNYREYVDDITNGIVIKAKRMAKNSEDINQIIDYVSETLKKKLAHETTIKLKELYPNLDEDKIEKLNKLFKEN
ncbi:MAG: glutamyl-tRNA reductase [Ectothiorhodospiraceae bacterium]|nr:MAG: glutamyl-tRNA reductase [Ectothiorhodospiraceae bacterium]